MNAGMPMIMMHACLHACAGVNVGPVHSPYMPYTPLSPHSQPSLRHELSGPPGVDALDTHAQAPAAQPPPQAQTHVAADVSPAPDLEAKQEPTAQQEADTAGSQQLDSMVVTPEAPSPAPVVTEEPKVSADAAPQADEQQGQGDAKDPVQAAPAAGLQLSQSTSTEAATSSSLSFLKSPK